jgi:hypothetical protein
MEEGDHSACPIELLACPDHKNSDLRADDTLISSTSSFAELLEDIYSPESQKRSACERRVLKRLIFLVFIIST